MELRHLRYFVAVAAHGSFNRAAQVLHLTQPALSRQVKDLEDELGVKLLDRGKNSCRLTAAGRRFQDSALDLLARAEQAIQQARGEPRAEVLRIGYAPSATDGILPRALERFYAVHPNVRVELVDVTPPEMIQLAVAGRLDLVIALEPTVTATAGFQWSEFRRLHLVLVMRKDHPLARYKRLAPKHLRDLPLIGLGRENFPDYVPHVRNLLKPHGFAPHFVALENDGVTTLFAGLEAHRVAALLADSVAAFLPRSLVWRPFCPRFAPVVAKIGLSTARPNPSARALVELLREELSLAEQAPSVAGRTRGSVAGSG